MRFTSILIGSLVIILTCSCSQETEVAAEEWAGKNVSEWPNFALTNKITFGDTSYTQLGNSFLVDTGIDTLGVSCKHLFMIFSSFQGYENVSFDDSFESWKAYLKDDPEKEVEFVNLINENENEAIAQFNTLKDRDWIVFKPSKIESNIYPLKIRYAPLKKDEVVYSYGWCQMPDDSCKHVFSKLKVFKSMGNYYYVNTLSTNGTSKGTSGSAVIDKNGYLVGIVSGAEGKLGVIGSIAYLQKLFDQYQIPYKKEV